MKKINLFFFTLLFSSNLYAVDAHQYLPGQLSPDHLISAKNSEIISRKAKKGQSSFTLSYLRDTFDYKDSRGVFKRTYEDGEKSVRAGFLQVAIDKYFYKGLVDITWGAGLGVGHSRGRGSFAGGDQSDTLFQLWSLPVDFIIGLEIPFSSFAKLRTYAGPSVMGLMQTRDDKSSEEKKKTRNQISYGYAAGAKIKIGLAKIWPDTVFGLFRDYNIANAFLNINMQIRNYSNFQDEDISIEGSSLGIGLSFEYL